MFRYIFLLSLLVLSVNYPLFSQEPPPLPPNSQILNGNLLGIRAIDSTIACVWGEHGTILLTYDNGRTWKQVDNAIGYDVLDVLMLGKTTLIAIPKFYDPILISTNTGKRWSSLSYFNDKNYKIWCGDVYEDIIVLAGDNGRVFLSNTAGNSWSIISPNNLVSAVKNLVIIDKKTFIIYTASSEAFITTDAGVSWKATAIPQKYEGIIKPIYDRSRNILRMAVDSSLYASNDLSATWQLHSQYTLPINSIAHTINGDVHIVQDNAVIILQGSSSRNGVIALPEYWIYRAPLRAIAGYPLQQSICVGNNKQIYIQHSDDTFRLRSHLYQLPVSASVSFPSVDTGFVVNDETLYLLRTTDAGATWQPLPIRPSPFISYAKGLVFINSFEGFFLSDNRLYKIEEGGEKIKNLTFDYPHDLLFISYIDTSFVTRVAYGKDSSRNLEFRLESSTDGGNDWKNVKGFNDKNLYPRHLLPLDKKGKFHLSGSYLEVLDTIKGTEITYPFIARTNDNGQNWSVRFFKDCWNYSFMNTFTIPNKLFYVGSIELAGGKNSYVIRSYNTETEIETTLDSGRAGLQPYSVSIHPSGYGVACGDKGTFLMTDDFGTTWVDNSQFSEYIFSRLFTPAKNTFYCLARPNRSGLKTYLVRSFTPSDTITSVDDDTTPVRRSTLNSAPAVLLDKIAPNPCKTFTTLTIYQDYSVPSSRSQIKVYSIDGCEVADLSGDFRKLTGGTNPSQLRWDIPNNLSTGAYLIVVQSPNHQSATPVIIER